MSVMQHQSNSTSSDINLGRGKWCGRGEVKGSRIWVFRTATHRGQHHRPAKQRKQEHTLEKINKEGIAERSVLAFLSTNPSSNFSSPAVKEGIK
jgi:hypothetical protein